MQMISRYPKDRRVGYLEEVPPGVVSQGVAPPGGVVEGMTVTVSRLEPLLQFLFYSKLMSKITILIMNIWK